jgi:hypothetical protein
MEDRQKINQILAKLNEGQTEPQWVVVPGWHALMVVNEDNDGYNPDMAKGMIVKSFINAVTGEVKVFHSMFVEKKK